MVSTMWLGISPAGLALCVILMIQFQTFSWGAQASWRSNSCTAGILFSKLKHSYFNYLFHYFEDTLELAVIKSNNHAEIVFVQSNAWLIFFLNAWEPFICEILPLKLQQCSLSLFCMLHGLYFNFHCQIKIYFYEATSSTTSDLQCLALAGLLPLD